MNFGKQTLAILLLSLALVSCSKKIETTSTGSGTISNYIVSTSSVASLGGAVQVSLPTSAVGNPLLGTLPDSYRWSTSSSYSSVSSSSCVNCIQSSVPFGTLPPWCIRRIGSHGEMILDANDPAFDCTKQAPPPYSLCPYIQVESYGGVQQSSVIGNLGLSSVSSSAGTPQWMNSQYLQGLPSLNSSYSSSSVVAPLSYVPTQARSSISSAARTGSGAASGGRDRLSISNALFNGDLSCGKGVTLGGILIGGNAPFSACVAKSPWKGYGRNINSF